ncbi:MAG: hypothetical protein IT384_21120, partial [Deltaproteobacteria bacterium]|nr:hypothetical protein [Deltaproteobacteria bacterium]
MPSRPTRVTLSARYVRVFEVTSDINVGLNVNVLPDNKLEAALGELRIDNFQETFNGLMPNADFAQILPTLLDVALQALLQNQLTFDVDITTAVSGALGGAPICMRVNEIKRNGAQEDYQTLDPSPTQLRFTIDTLAPLVAGELVRDSVEARVSDAGSTPEQLTLRGRFDGGEWFDVPLLFEDAHTARGLVPLAGVTAARLELVGTDAAGNESRAAKIVVG